jgi:acyl-CoA thioester hydrolase
VYVDNEHGAGNRPVVPMPDAIRAAVEPLLRA